MQHWVAILLTVVVTNNRIRNAASKESEQDYLDYASDEEDLISDHYSDEPSYISEIRKYRRLGVDYELHPVPVPVYYPVHVPKPYYSKKLNYPSHSSSYKPYKYSKSKPYYGKEHNEGESFPSNNSESSPPSPSSKLSPRESSYKSRIHDDEYSRPFTLRNRPVDDHPHPIPFKDLDPEFTTPIPTPPPPPKRKSPVSSAPSSKRPTPSVKLHPEKFGTQSRKADNENQYRAVKPERTSENAPRVESRYKESTRPPPRRYQNTRVDTEDQRLRQSPSSQGRSEQYSTRAIPKSPRPRQLQRKRHPDHESSSPRRKPSAPRYPSESTSERPQNKQADELATKLGFENFKGSFGDVIKYDGPFAKESNEKTKGGLTKPSHSFRESRREEEQEREGNARRPSLTRRPTTKVRYDDDYDDADETSHTPKNDPRNRAYKRYEDRAPERPERGYRDHQQNYKPTERHSSTQSSRSEPYRERSYSSPPPARKYSNSRERTHKEYIPREEREYHDRPTLASSSDSNDDEVANKEKLIPRRYVPSKRHYEREDRREPESAEESSEESSAEESEVEDKKPRSRSKRHNPKPKSWQRIVNESHITTISSSNPSVLKIFKAMKIGTSDEGVVLLDTRVTKDKEGQVRQILTKSIPLLKQADTDDVPACARGNQLEYCLTDTEYPRKSVLEALQKNNGQWRSLLNIRPGSDNIQRRFIVRNGTISSGCKSINSWILPLRAKDVDGLWRVVANVDEFKQSVNIELCSKEKEACNSNQSVCEQQTVERHLVTFSSNNELSLKRFKFPSYCSCVKGEA